MPSLLQHIQLCVIKIHLALVVHDRGDHCAGSHLRDFLQRCGPCRTSLGYCNAKQRVPIHSKSSKRRINSGGAMARGCATIVVGNELLVKCFRLPLRDAQAPGTSIIIIERCSSAHISLTHSPATSSPFHLLHRAPTVTVCRFLLPVPFHYAVRNHHTTQNALQTPTNQGSRHRSSEATTPTPGYMETASLSPKEPHASLN
jgi:hypothetical protein